jgi:RNA polymerase sigma factor (TIGR02999 family)
VYDELRAIARRHRRGLPGGQTLNTTAVVHEAYVKVFGTGAADLKDRSHFFGVACLAMRQILVDAARRRLALRRGGGAHHTGLKGDEPDRTERLEGLLALDEALVRLRISDARLAEVVDLRYFGGLTVEEVAEMLEVTPRTVQRDWSKARAFLASALI